MQEDIIKYYIDNKHIEDISGDVSATIIREDGFANSEQILREKTDSQLIAYGCGFKAFADKRKESYCEDIGVKIKVENDTLFTGTIRQSDLSVQVAKGIIKVNNIKDTNWSNDIAQYKDTEIPLYATTTIGGEALELLPQIIYRNFTLNKGICYKATDIITFLVNYITNNKVDVVFNDVVFTNIAITTGYAMRYTNGTSEQMYPTVSLGQVLQEVRKATTLYCIMTKIADKDVLIIDKEKNTFGDNLLLNIDNIPFDLEEVYDENNIFNKIILGGQNQIETKPNRDDYFAEIELVSCGCKGLKDNDLDLRFEFVVHNSMILRQGDLINYYDEDVWNDEIFMFQLKEVSGELRYDIPNIKFRNNSVLAMWLGLGINCFNQGMNAKHGFQTRNRDDFAVSNELEFLFFKEPLVVEYDRLLSLRNWIFSINGLPPHAYTQAGMTYYECQEAGVYKFKAKLSYKSGVDAIYIGGTNEITIELRRALTSGNLINNIGTQIIKKELPNGYLLVNGEDFHLEVEGSFFLAVNDVVCSKMYVKNTYGSGDLTYQEFTLLQDSTTEINVSDNEFYKPFLAKFKYDLCFADYERMRKDKTGIIRINNKNAWIKEVRYNPFGMSDITIKYKETLIN